MFEVFRFHEIFAPVFKAPAISPSAAVIVIPAGDLLCHAAFSYPFFLIESHHVCGKELAFY